MSLPKRSGPSAGGEGDCHHRLRDDDVVPGRVDRGVPRRGAPHPARRVSGRRGRPGHVRGVDVSRCGRSLRRRTGQDRHSRLHQHPCAPRRVADRQVRAGGRRQPAVLADRADRDPADRDGRARRRGRAGVPRLLADRARAYRHHDRAADGWHRGVRRGRHRGERAAGVRRADVPLRPVVHAGRQAGRLRLGRGRRAAGLRAGDRVRRAAARTGGRTGAGLPGAGPGRHVQRGAPTRLTRGRRRPRRPHLAARLARGVGVPGDDAAPRTHPRGVARGHRVPRPSHRARPCDLHQRQLVGELCRRRPRAAGIVRHICLLQRLVLHPAWDW